MVAPRAADSADPSIPYGRHGGDTTSVPKVPAETAPARGAARDSIAAMRWGTVELEDEVVEWLERLDDDSFGQAERYIDLLADEGVHLGEPFTRQLRGKLRELRFSLDRRRVRITYYIASGRRIVLLTVFVKAQRQERREIDRAEKAMQRCIAEGHTVEEDQ